MIDELLKVINIDLTGGTKSVEDYAKAVDNAAKSADNLNESLDSVKKTSEGGILKGVTAGFNEAVDATLGEIGKIDAEFAGLGYKVKDFIKVFKAFTTSAVSGLNAVKAALAGTGIGLIIIAATTLYARFDDIKKALGITENSFNEFKKTALGVLQDIVGGVVALGSSIYGAISGAIKMTFNVIKTFAANVVNLVSTAAKSITEGPKAFVKNMGDAITRMWNDMKSTSVNSAKDLVNGVVNQWHAGFESGTKLIQNLFKEKAEETVTTIKSISAKAQEDLLQQTIDRLEQEYEYKKKWNETSLLDDKTKAQRSFEIEQESYQKRLEAYDLYIENFNGTAEEKAKLEEERERLKNEAILADREYTNDLIRQAEEEEKARKLEEEEAEKVEREDKRNYELEMAELEITDEEEKQRRIYELKRQALLDDQSLLEKELANFRGAELEKEKLERKLQTTKAKIRKADSEQANKEIALDQKRRQMVMQGTLSTASSLFGSLSKLAGEHSKAGKALAVAQTTIDTFQSAQSAYKSMAGIPYVGPALGIAAAAAAVAAGVVNIKNILSTDEQGETSAPSVPATPSAVSATPEQSIPQVAVSPMLDEFRDLNQMQSLNINGESGQRVYVVESDIQEVGNRVEVRENEATF